MPQNILKNQIALEAASTKGLNRNNSSFSSSLSEQQQQQNQYHHNPNKAHTTNTTFGSNSISRLNQGKLNFLNEKFSHKSENNYDELITKPPISKYKKSKCKKDDQDAVNCQCCHMSQENIKLRKNHHQQSETNQKKRLSCEELEDLSERFADFIKIDATMSQQKVKTKAPPPPLDHSPPLPPPPPDLLLNDHHDTNTTLVQIPSRLSSRLSVLSAESSSGAELSLASSSSSHSSCSVKLELKSAYSASNINRPEPPQRTVSIRNTPGCSGSVYSTSDLKSQSSGIVEEETMNPYAKPTILRQQEDSVSIKSSSIYSSCRGSIGPSFTNSNVAAVRSSRSVFSIYEEEDEICTNSSGSSSSSSSTSSSSSSSTAGRLSSSSASSSCNNILSNNKLERLNEFEIKKIESMYRSIGSIVYVSACTCDFFTTTSEQIANLLHDCWKLEINSIVPIWIFDTGFNPKRSKQLRLLFVDRHTAFPLTTKTILINKWNELKNPTNDKRLTFTLRNKQLVCLIQFFDFFSCQEFFKFYTNLVMNPRNVDLFGNTQGLHEIERIESNVNSNNTIKMNHSRSMMSLSMNNGTIHSSNNFNTNKINKSNRYSEFIKSSKCLDDNDLMNSNKKLSKMKTSATTGNLKQLANGASTTTTTTTSIPLMQQMTITKNCISNPCAFLHINSLKDGDQRVKLIVENCDNTDKKFQ